MQKLLMPIPSLEETVDAAEKLAKYILTFSSSFVATGFGRAYLFLDYNSPFILCD